MKMPRRVTVALAVVLVASSVPTSTSVRAESNEAAPVRAAAMAGRIAAGEDHSCVLLDSGRVACWGEGDGGKLGYGNTNDIGDNETPATNPVNGGAVPLPIGQTAVAITAGGTHTCALLAYGQVACWGRGVNGQLGYGNTNDIGDDDTPATNPINGGLVDLAGGRTATAIASGVEHTCALLDSGQVTCWGAGGQGRLGYGNTDTIGDDETPATNPVSGGIVPLPGGQTATAISAGGFHTCALLASGQITCWGNGGQGQLGYGNTNDIGDDEAPAANPANGGVVALPGGQTAQGITAGGFHTCALLTSGALACWGVGGGGQLGYGNTSTIGDDETPATNPAGGGFVALPGSQTAIAITAGTYHTCALLREGQLTCWGSGDNGRLGYGNTSTIGDDETPATNPAGGGFVALPGGQTARAIEAGTFHNCAVLASGNVSCWGFSNDGETGYGNTATIGDDETPAANPAGGGIVALPGGQTATAIAAGHEHTCALLANGQVTCWGLGGQGRLGYGNENTIGDNETPAANPVNGGIVALPGGRTAVALAAGLAHTCALLADGRVTCWGLNFWGQLGYGNTNTIGDNETPAANPVNGGLVTLPGGQTAVAITASQHHTCALLADGRITCWGDGGIGQLGYGNENDIGDNETPAANPVNGGLVPLPGAQTATAISAGGTTNCAVLASGQVTCWGFGGNGQLGYGNTNTIGDDETPAANPVNGGMVPLPGGQIATAVSADHSHTCAVLASRQVTCWGYNASGQLGYANTTTIGDDETPATNPVNGGIVALPNALGATAITTGESHTCALLVVAQITCWGFAGGGSLGYGNTNDIGDDETPAGAGTVALPNPLRASDLVPLPPSRLVDTRPGFSTIDGHLQGGGTRAAGSTLVVPVRGRGVVPINATAAVVSISAVAPAGPGFAIAYPCDHALPTAASLNYQTGVTVSNTALGTLSSAGTLCIYTSQAIDLVVDVNAATPASSAMVGVRPARLADTRPGRTTIDNQFNGIGRRVGGTTLTLDVAGRGPVPGTARAVAVNVVAVNPASAGFLTVFTCGQPIPNASSLNYQAGTTTANFVHTTTSDLGTICIYTDRDADLVVDVVGWHDTGSPAPTLQHPLPNSRLVDTRPGFTTVDGRFAGGGQRSAGSTLIVPIAGRFPTTAARVASLNLTVIGPARTGFIVAYPCDQPRPNTATLTFRAGVTRSAGILAGLSIDGTLCLYTSQATHLVIDINGTTL